MAMGGSRSPYDIFKDIGLDTSDPGFFEIGLKSVERDVLRLEKLLRTLDRKKK
jgi:oligoendopeptidase F